MVKACVPVIPCRDIEKSLRFWVDGLGLEMDRPMKRDGRLIGCMVQNESLAFWLNISDGNHSVDGIRLYWAPEDIRRTRLRLAELGFEISGLEDRDYGQTEFFVTDVDGFSHCFGVATNELNKSLD